MHFGKHHVPERVQDLGLEGRLTLMGWVARIKDAVHPSSRLTRSAKEVKNANRKVELV